MDEKQAQAGWSSDLPAFRKTPPAVIRGSLESFVRGAGTRQIKAWDDSIPVLQEEAGEVLDVAEGAAEYTAILEYQLPMELRRPDVVVLADGVIVVLELKGKREPSQADLDQTAAYARDLRCYHRECHERPILAVCVPMQARGYLYEKQGIHVAGPDHLDRLILSFRSRKGAGGGGPRAERFLDENAYRPLPTLVRSARELFDSGTIRRIHRAHAATEPAVESLVHTIHEAARTRTRHLVLLSGVPGAGKTLVGLRIVHSDFLDDLAVARQGRKPGSPAVFLSGNGPLVEVLQYELRSAGGGGSTFVRGVMPYIQRYIPRPDLVPPEHVIVFDEAQRAFDPDMIRQKHSHLAGFGGGKSEPDLIVEIADRIPEWCVVVGLIGGGQEIHVGEEGGIGQWRTAIERSPARTAWTVHCPPALVPRMTGPFVDVRQENSLNLDTEIRFHLAPRIHDFVAGLLGALPPGGLRRDAELLDSGGYHLRITRDLETARQYLRERYADHAEARFGILASSKDRDLVAFGVANDFTSTKKVRIGPWYGDDETAPGGSSCRMLRQVVTEFGAQGLELDGVLLAWGTDFAMRQGAWSTDRARGYLRSARVRDARQLRVNAYRVLLTRGRDGTTVFVPPLPELDETFEYLGACGFVELTAVPF